MILDGQNAVSERKHCLTCHTQPPASGPKHSSAPLTYGKNNMDITDLEILDEIIKLKEENKKIKNILILLAQALSAERNLGIDYDKLIKPLLS